MQRVVVRSSWCKPAGGWVKINMAVAASRRSCGFIIRNAGGQFCLAGVYAENLFGNTVRMAMEQDIWAWCRRKKIERVVLESDEPELIMAMNQMGRVRSNVCSTKVNCFACCLADRCDSWNVVFLRESSLPRHLVQLLSLEGIPHFAFAPGLDLAGP